MKRGRPRKILLPENKMDGFPMKEAVNKPLMEAAVDMAQGLLNMYQEEKLAIQHK